MKSLIISAHGLLPILEILERCTVKSRQYMILQLLKVVNAVSSTISRTDHRVKMLIVNRSSSMMSRSRKTYASSVVSPFSPNSPHASSQTKFASKPPRSCGRCTKRPHLLYRCLYQRAV